MSTFNYLYEDPTLASFTASTNPTPYGIYNDDSAFISESISVSKYVAKKLGHPVMQLEFNSGSIWACFEEAVNEYSQQIHHYNTKNWMWEHYGNSNKESGSQMSSTGSHQAETSVGGMSLFTLSEQYGQAVNVGGNTTMYTGSITLTGSQQVYDLESEASLESAFN